MVLSPIGIASILFDLVYYGHFSAEYVEKMKPFEREHYHKLLIEAKKNDDKFNMAIHGATEK